MPERESTAQRDRQRLQDIFVSVTGETVITDRQDQGTHKKVISPTEADSSPSDQRYDADPVNRFDDTIGDQESE